MPDGVSPLPNVTKNGPNPPPHNSTSYTVGG